MLFESSNLRIFRFERSKTLKRVLRVSQFFSRSTDMDIQTDLKYCVQQSNNVWKRHKGKNFNRHLRSLLYIVSWNDNYYFFFSFHASFLQRHRSAERRRDEIIIYVFLVCSLSTFLNSILIEFVVSLASTVMFPRTRNSVLPISTNEKLFNNFHVHIII